MNLLFPASTWEGGNIDLHLEFHKMRILITYLTCLRKFLKSPLRVENTYRKCLRSSPNSFTLFNSDVCVFSMRFKVKVSMVIRLNSDSEARSS